jgi:hypothetical protein
MAIIKMNWMVRNLGNISPSPSELSKGGLLLQQMTLLPFSQKKKNCPTVVCRKCVMAACHHCNIITFKDGHFKAQIYELIKQHKPQY